MYASSIAGIIRIPDSLCCIIIKDFAWLDTVALLPATQSGTRALAYARIAFSTIFDVRKFAGNPAGRIRAGALSSIDSLNSPTKYEIARNSVLSESK